MPLLLIAGLAFLWFGKSQAIDSGLVVLKGLNEPVTIVYSDYGIPQVNTLNDADAYFSLGFLHAQNRLWQMEINRRTARGLLSEIIGKEALRSDIYVRTLGLERNAERMWKTLGEKDRAVLRSYVKGVNQGIEALGSLPVEYKLLKFKPVPWTEIDSLIWMQLMTMRMGGGFSSEIERSLLLQAFGAEKLSSLMPRLNLSNTLSSENIKLDFQALSVKPDFYRASEGITGSNAFVLSGKYTTSGLPILANDPHLSNSVPSVFYIANIRSTNMNVVGATFPGLPFVVIGRNQHIAWGITSMMADNEDVFLERVNPSNKNQYLLDDEYVDMEVYTEEIPIKKKPFAQQENPHIIEVRRTAHGPLLSDLIGGHQNYAFSLRWTGDDQDGGTFSAFLKLNYARNWLEFNDALTSYVAPIQNFLYADVEGNIGQVAPGKYPVRAANNGVLPTAGWVKGSAWEAWIAFDDWPRTYNPEKGIIVSANNKFVAEDYPFYISADWAPDYRANRIENLIHKLVSEKNEITGVEELMAIQLDVRSPGKSVLFEMLKLIEPANERQVKAIKVLRDWDGDMDTASTGALLFSAWISHFTRLLLEDDVNRLGTLNEAERVLGKYLTGENLELVEAVVLNKKSDWCDYVLTSEEESCTRILGISLEHSLNEISKKQGSNIDDWRWGSMHKAQYSHYPFSDSKLAPNQIDSPDYAWSPLFHLSIESPGGGNTVNLASVSYDTHSRYSQFYGASYRQVIDLASENQIFVSLSTGQSGDVFSDHYDDLLVHHRDGNYINPLAHGARPKLVLEPEQGSLP